MLNPRATPLTPAPTDDRPRIEATARIGGEFVRLLDGILSATSPQAKLLRRLTAPDGGHLFSTADMTAGAVWWPAGTLADVLRALKLTTQAVPCHHCPGRTCRKCRGAGLIPPVGTALALSPDPATLPVEGDVAELWGWVRQLGNSPGKS